MKKTLITLMALSSVAMADAGYDYLWSGAFGKKDDVMAFSFTDASSPITLTITSSISTDNTYADGVLTGSTDSSSTFKTIADEGYGDCYAPYVKISDGDSWTLNFTIENTSAEVLTLHSIGFETFVYNSGGSLQSATDGKYRDVKFNLDGAITGEVEYRFCGPEGQNPECSRQNTAWLHFVAETPIELSAGEQVTFSLLAEKGSTNEGSYVGVRGMQVYIPEPATATLSLLALCGLAARRRRK